MRSVSFPYGLYRGEPSPIIPLRLRGPKGWKELWAYVDSGASISILAEGEARLLGFDLNRGELTYSVVGDGSLIPVYIHRLPLSIGPFKLKARVGFSTHLGVGFNLLGRKDIFEKFDVTFSDSRRQITFRPAP